MRTLTQLKKCKKDILINLVFNNWCADVCDEDTDDHSGDFLHGKRIPYIGWFWRSVSFSQGYASIGNVGDYIGVMCSNKWDHPERYLTKEEFKVFTKYLNRAVKASNQGGILAEILENRNVLIVQMSLNDFNLKPVLRHPPRKLQARH